MRTNEMQGFIARWRAGDRTAADGLIRRTGNRLPRLAARMYRGFPNVRPLAEPGDVVQASWLRLLHTLRSLTPDSTREFFILAAVHIRRELLDLARKAKSRPLQTVSLHLAGGDVGSSDFPVAEPEHREPDDFDLWARFHVAVEELPDDLREIVNLVFYHGRTQREIAAWFGKDERTIRRWWAEACLELRARVGGQIPGAPEEN
jgi:RNA polymerase sigma-70 factor (ECF subfamily)